MFLCAFFIPPSPFPLNLDRCILGLTQLPDPQPLLCPLLRFSPHHFAQHLPKFIHPPACCAFPAICLSIAHLLPYGCFPPTISGSCRYLRNISPTFFSLPSSPSHFSTTVITSCLPPVAFPDPLACTVQPLIHTPLISCVQIILLSSPPPILPSCSSCLVCNGFYVSTPWKLSLPNPLP